MSDRLMRAALTCAERGWHVFPCTPGGKPPAIPDQDWQHLATTGPAQIRSWWTEHPYNIGIDCGHSGLVVIDLDIPGHGRRAPGEVPDRNTGLDTLARLCAQQAQPVPGPTFTVATPSGGLHLYFSPADVPVRSSKERLGRLIDVRGTGGYVIAPGSYRDGGYYTVLNSQPLVPLSPEQVGVLTRATRRRGAPGRKRSSPGTVRGSGELWTTGAGDRPGDPARTHSGCTLPQAGARPYSPARAPRTAGPRARPFAPTLNPPGSAP